MKNVKALIDAGPLIALFDASDHFHKRVINFLENYTGQLLTTSPVITETLHILSFSTLAQQNFLEWLCRGSLDIRNLDSIDIGYIKNRMIKYADLPMDLADASLMCIAEKEKIHEIISIDSDFNIYRTLQGDYLKNLL